MNESQKLNWDTEIPGGSGEREGILLFFYT